MDINELRRFRAALERFAQEFDGCVKTVPSRRHLLRYLNGQLGPLGRKSVEPIALDAGIPPRTLQEFLSQHRWDEEAVARRLRALAVRDHPDPNGIGVIDETSFAKKGDKTPGVQRQYCGSTGKIDNGVVTVHLGYVTGDFHALLDGDLFLPEETWSNNRSRCRAAKIPDSVVYRPKWQIALELTRRCLQEGVQLRWITADEFYGRAKEFRDGVSDLGPKYVVEIPSNLSGWIRKPEVEPPGTVTASGHQLAKARLADGERPARLVSKLWKRGGPSWIVHRIKDTQEGPEVWKVRETRFWPNDDGAPGREGRLIIAREVLAGETKYFLSDAGPEVPLTTLLCVAFSRWHIERLFEDAKGEVGFDHFEVRNYVSLMRHLVLTNLSVYFLAEQTDRLRKKKAVVDCVPGQGSRRGSTGPSDLGQGAHASAGEGRREDHVLSSAEQAGRPFARQTQAA